LARATLEHYAGEMKKIVGRNQPIDRAGEAESRQFEDAVTVHA
jgi:hypothetical protein